MTIKSTIVGNEAFLQGQFLSLSINRDGGIGARAAAPTGFYSDTETGYNRVGMLADLDGFGKGQAGVLTEALLLGRAIEGFNVGYKMGGNTITHQNQSLTGFSDIAGVTSATSDKGQIGWKGSTTEKLAVAQKVTLLDDASFVRIDVTLTNNSGVKMTDVRYMRTADPDQDGKFATTNKIVRQGDDGALLSSSFGGDGSFFLFSEDDRAVVSTYGFVNTDPYAPAAFDAAQSQGFTRTADETVNITFGLGTLDPGESATVTLYVGVTDDLAATVKRIEAASDDDDGDDGDGDDGDPAPVDLAPVAKNDKLKIDEDSAGSGNVLANDRDPEGDALTASLTSGPSNGTVKLSSNGDYVYTPEDGFSGTDRFTYAASDGKNSDAATVTITVEAAPPEVDPVPDASPLLSRAGTQNGSKATDATLKGPAYQNSFFFDVTADSGDDTIVNFENDDILVVNRTLPDSNADGLLALAMNTLSIDGATGNDTVNIEGVLALRLLGTDEFGLSAYGNASVRPDGAIESKLGDERLTGDARDRETDVFFFDTALDLDLGADRVDNFGSRDLLVTTSALFDRNGDGTVNFSDGIAKLAGSSGGPGNAATPGEAGTVAISSIDGDQVNALEFDGSVVRDGTTYYVYSLAGSAVDAGDLGF